jgi:hypothetical protein
MTGRGFSARAVLGVAVVALLACAHASTSAPVETVDAGADAAAAGNVLTGFGLLIVSELVTDGRDLYVAVSGGGEGEIERVLPDGSRASFLASSPSPWGLAVDDDWAYWTDDGPAPLGRGVGPGTIRRVSKSGGPAQDLVASPYPAEIAVDDTNVYWIDIDQRTLTIRAAPKSADDGGATSATMLVAPNGALSMSGLALDATHVYWVEGDTLVAPPDSLPPTSLRRVPKTGGAAETVATGLFYGGIASDSAAIYVGVDGFSGGQPGGILRYDTATGQTELLGSGDFTPGGVAVDATNAYWTDSRGILAAPLAGGGAVQLAAPAVQGIASTIAVANGAVYWANGDAIWSISMPSGS